MMNLINIILETSLPNDFEIWAADINQDGFINVLDVMSLVIIILD